MPEPTSETLDLRTEEDIVRVRQAIRRLAQGIGFSIVDQEYEVGFRSLSVPVRDRGGTVVAALNVCCPSPRVSLETMRETFLPALVETAVQVGALVPEGFVRRGPQVSRAVSLRG